MLILGAAARADVVPLRGRQPHTEVGRVGALVEAALQRVGGLRHVAVRHRFRLLLAQVVLVSQVSLHRHQLVAPRRVAQHLQVVHALVRQVDVAARVVVVDVAEAHLQSVGIGKEAALRVAVRNAHVGVEVIAGIAQHHAAVALPSRGVAQPLVLQAYPVAVVLNAVRRHLIVGIVDKRQVGAVEEAVLSAANLRRDAQLLVVRAAEELHGALQPLRRYVVGEEVQHAADGIRAIEQCGRSLHHFGAVHAELVDFQSVVVAPLLPLVLHAVLRYRHAVEAQAADGGLRLAGAYRHRLHAGNALQRLHQTAREVLFQEVLTDLHGRLRRLHLEVALGLTRHRHAAQRNGRVVDCPQRHCGSQNINHHI